MKEEHANVIYRINHSFREEIIVPLAAITNNIEFLFDKNDKKVLLGDGVVSSVVSFVEEHICAFEADINRIYGVPPWNFLKRWYVNYPNMDSMTFLKIRLKKDE